MLLPVAAVLLGVASTAGPARAQDNAATVEALFDEGKKLEAKGDYAAACPKFLSSYNLEHRLGTLLNLAYCYEENGQLASAWARFVEARSLATQAGQKERAEFAAQHATALEPRLPRLVIVASPTTAPGMQVKRDGTPVDPAQYGVAVPVDAGDHVVEASAPGKQPWKDTVHVGASAVTSSLTVPVLADAQATPPPPAPGSPSPPSPAVTQPPAPSVPPETSPAGEASRLGTRKVVGLITGGVGLAGLATGSVFGLLTKSAIDAQNRDCASSSQCPHPDQAQADHRTEQADSTIATVTFIAGGALLATGAVLFFLGGGSAPASAASSSLVVTPTLGWAGGGVSVGGAF